MTTFYQITLKQLRDNNIYYESYNKLVRALQHKKFTKEDSERNSYIRFSHEDLISLEYILKNNGLDDALWCFRCMPTDNMVIWRDIMLLMIAYARMVQHVMTDERSVVALDVAEKFANGEATVEELKDACKTASAAYYDVVSVATTYAINATIAAYYAADFVVNVAVDVPNAATNAAAYATNAAYYANAAIKQDLKQKQEDLLLQMLQGRAPWQVTA